MILKINPFVTKKARKITAMQYISLRKHSDMSELHSRYAKTPLRTSEKYDVVKQSATLWAMTLYQHNDTSA